MSRDEELQDRLRRLTHAMPREAGAAVERELRARFRARDKHRRRQRIYVAEVAAALLLATGVFLAFTHGRGEPDRAKTISPANEFIELPYAQSGVPVEQAVIVRVRVPASELSGMGLSLAVAPSSNTQMSADLLVGQDGVARAVRLVQ